MSKKRTIRRRGLSAVLALSVCFGLLPPTAGAAVTAEHDWEKIGRASCRERV